jgi:hypothetical protein
MWDRRKIADRKPLRIKNLELEAPPGFEPGIEVLQPEKGLGPKAKKRS